MMGVLRFPSVTLYIKHFWVDTGFCGEKDVNFSSSTYFENNFSEFMLCFVSGGGTGQVYESV